MTETASHFWRTGATTFLYRDKFSPSRAQLELTTSSVVAIAIAKAHKTFLPIVRITSCVTRRRAYFPLHPVLFSTVTHQIQQLPSVHHRMASTSSAPAKEENDATSSPVPTTADRKGKRPPRGKAPDRDVQISKALSKLLRHDAEKYKLKLDAEGYAPLDKVVSINSR